MKIQNSDPQQAISRVTTEKASSHGKPAAAAPASTGAAAVHLSDAGRKLASARAPEAPDEARVAHIRGLISSGKLHIDAGAMLRQER